MKQRPLEVIITLAVGRWTDENSCLPSGPGRQEVLLTFLVGELMEKRPPLKSCTTRLELNSALCRWSGDT